MKNNLGIVVAGILATGACSGDPEADFYRIIGSDYDIPITQESPDMTVDVSAQVVKLEDQINDRKANSNDDRVNYEVLLALCKSEANAVCDPPAKARFPSRIPRYIWPYGCITAGTPPVLTPADQCTAAMTCEPTDPATLTGGFNPASPPSGNGCVDVSTWMSQVEGIDDLTTVAQATKFDLSSQGSLKNVSQVKKVTVNRVTFKFKDNSFNYAIPTTKAYAGKPVSDSEAQNAKLLINGDDTVSPAIPPKVTLFGTLPEIAPAYTGNRNMQLNSDGKVVLSDAIRGFKATLAGAATLVIPPPTDATLPDNCKDTTNLPCEGWPKPGGQIKFSVEVEVVFTVNAQG